MKPEIFLKTLTDTWPVLSMIWSRHEGRVFSESDLFRAIRANAGFDQQLPATLANRLVSTGVLTENKRGGRGFLFNNHLTPFIQFILEEQKLGLIAEITANTDTLHAHLDRIRLALLDGKRGDFFAQCCEMEDRFYVLQRLVDQNTKAIYKLVDDAKQANRNLGVAERYAKVIRAWDDYVTPALQMKSPGQPFSLVMSQATREFQSWLEDYSMSVLSSDDARAQLESVQFRMLDFREVLDKSVDLMSRTLGPLVNQARINTQISQGAALAFRHLSKSTLSPQVSQQLKLPGRVRATRRADPLTLLEFHARLMSVDRPEEQRTVNLDEATVNRKSRTRSTTVSEMVHWLKAQRPVNDTMKALRAQFPLADVDNLCQALHVISHDDNLRRFLMTCDEMVSYEFEELTIVMNRRSLTSKAQKKPNPFFVEEITFIPHKAS
ncbi:hypothetical protein IFT69_15990 [Pseudomonas putida]|nr:hypothetical protein [Pseudomonas putida]